MLCCEKNTFEQILLLPSTGLEGAFDDKPNCEDNWKFIGLVFSIGIW